MLPIRERLIALIPLLLCLGAYSLRAEGAPETYTPEMVRMQVWINQLNDTDFEKRSFAREALAKAGPAARKLLEAAKDSDSLETKKAVSELLNALRWRDLTGPVAYLDILPAEPLIVAYAPSIKTLLEHGKNSALGKMLQQPQMQVFQRLLEKKAFGEGQVELAWLKALEGQAAAVVTSLSVDDDTTNRAAFFFEVAAPDPQAWFKAFIQQWSYFANAKKRSVEGLSVLTYPENDSGAVALAGKHLILGLNVDSVMEIARALAAAPEKSLAKSEAWSNVKPVVAGADLFLVFDLDHIVRSVGKEMLALGIPGLEGNGQETTVGKQGLQWAGWTMKPCGERFEEHFFAQFREPLTKRMAMIRPPFPMKRDAWDTTLKEAPADAAYLVSAQLPKVEGVLPEVSALMQEDKVAADASELLARIERFPFPLTQEYRFKETIGFLKSTRRAGAPAVGLTDVLSWAQYPREGKPREFQTFGTAGPEPAKSLASDTADFAHALTQDLLATAVKEGTLKAEEVEKRKQPYFTKEDWKGTAIYTEQISTDPAHGPFLNGMLESFHCWAPSVNRLLFSTQADALRKTLDARTAGAPGFAMTDTEWDDVKDATIPMLILARMDRMLEYDARTILKRASAHQSLKAADRQDAAALLGKPDLFKGTSPLAAVIVLPQPNVLSIRVRSPLPVPLITALWVEQAYEDAEAELNEIVPADNPTGK